MSKALLNAFNISSSFLTLLRFKIRGRRAQPRASEYFYLPITIGLELGPMDRLQKTRQFLYCIGYTMALYTIPFHHLLSVHVHLPNHYDYNCQHDILWLSDLFFAPNNPTRKYTPRVRQTCLFRLHSLLSSYIILYLFIKIGGAGLLRLRPRMNHVRKTA